MSGQPDSLPPCTRLRTTSVLAGLAVCVVATSCFWLSDGPLIGRQDSILRLPLLSYWRHLGHIFSADFTAFTEGQYRPLPYALLAVVRTFVSADNVRFWQLWLLAFQVFHVWLVYAAAQRLLGNWRSGATAAAVFALHPLAGVVLNDIGCFHYALGLALFLGSLCAYTGFAAAPHRAWRSAVSVSLFACALLCTKAAIALPVVLGAYEFARRTPVRRVVVRLLPYLALVMVVAPLWLAQTAHPMRYTYEDAPPGTWRRSLVSVVAGSGDYMGGLLLGAHVPARLTEIVAKREWGADAGLLVPAAFYILLATLAVRFLWRERGRGAADHEAALSPKAGAGFALVWAFATFAPFASMGWNCVAQFVSWGYMYFPLVGLALLAATLVAPAAHTMRRTVAACVLFVWCAGLGLQLVKLNLATRSAESYWKHVLSMNPDGEQASVELGREYLRRGDVETAQRYLFNPSVVDTRRSCLAMAGYYLRRGNLLAAAVHCQMAPAQTSGLKNQEIKPRLARLMRLAGAVDHAEAAWGEVLAANPFHVEAMAAIAELWYLKGFVKAARRLIAQAREISPDNEALRRVEDRIRSARDPAPEVAVAAMQYVRYFTQFHPGSRVSRDVIALAERLPGDAMVQLQAAAYLMREDRPADALRRLEAALPALQPAGLLWALKCYAHTQLGQRRAANAAAAQALEAEDRDARAYGIVGMAMMQQGRLPQATAALRLALSIAPNLSAVHANLALALQRMGRLDEAMPHFQKAAELDPTDVDSHVRLASAWLEKGKPNRAAASARAALRLDPQSVMAHLLLGDALMQKGERKAAAGHLARAEQLAPGCTRHMPAARLELGPKRPWQWRRAQ